MKDLPPPHLRDAGGNIFGGHIDEDGKMIPRPGAGALSKMEDRFVDDMSNPWFDSCTCRTETIRSGRDGDGGVHYEGLSHGSFTRNFAGDISILLPDHTLRGYSRTGIADDSVRTLAVQNDTSGDCVVIRRKESKTMTLHSLRSPELDVLFKIFSRIESCIF